MVLGSRSTRGSCIETTRQRHTAVPGTGLVCPAGGTVYPVRWTLLIVGDDQANNKCCAPSIEGGSTAVSYWYHIRYQYDIPGTWYTVRTSAKDTRCVWFIVFRLVFTMDCVCQTLQAAQHQSRSQTLSGCNQFYYTRTSNSYFFLVASHSGIPRKLDNLSNESTVLHVCATTLSLYGDHGLLLWR